VKKLYTPYHFNHVQNLFESWGIKIHETDLPQLGFVNDNAACFIVTTDTKACLIEFLISRKGSETRDQDLDEVVNACLELAQSLGFKKVIAVTAIQKVIERAEKHGFEKKNLTHYLVKEI
jgi:hypothetical protein